MRPSNVDSSDRLSRLLRILYEASADAQHWPVFVEEIIRQTGADCSFVMALGKDQSPALYSHVGFDEERRRSYQRHFYQHDLILKRFRQAAYKHGSWIGGRDSLLSDSELERSEFYNDYMRPMNHYHQAGVSLGTLGQYPLTGITLVRSRSAGCFDAATVSLLRIISPHLKQAVLLHQKLSALEVEQTLFSHALEANGIACIAVSDKGMLQGRTAAAEALLIKADGLYVVAGRLRAQDVHEEVVLQEILHRACQAGSGNHSSLRSQEAPGGELTIKRRRSNRPLQIAIMPFHSDEPIMGSKPAAVIFIIDPDAKVASRTYLLRRLYRLTPAEARLCEMLLQGFDVKASADQLRITEASARFVLQQIFEKTAVNSQSGLMRLIMALPALKTMPRSPLNKKENVLPSNF